MGSETLERINKHTEMEATEFVRTHHVQPLRRKLDNTIYAFRCLRCGSAWKVYQSSCGCVGTNMPEGKDG